MSSTTDEIDALFPVNERIKIWRKANKMFKVDVDTVINFWRRNADPLRGTIIRTNNHFILVNYTRPDQFHISDVIRYVVYGERTSMTVLTEHRLRLMARGILYHKLFKRRFAPQMRAVFEIPITCVINGVVLIGTVDVIVFLDDKTYLIEVKSSTTDATLNFGTLQAKLYWTILERFTDVKISSSYVVTPKHVLRVDKPLTKGEFRRLIQTWMNEVGHLNHQFVVR